MAPAYIKAYRKPKQNFATQTCSAAKEQKLAGMVVQTLEVIRNEESFDLEPKFPRQRKRPEFGEADPEFHSDPKLYFQQIYYEAIEFDRFKQVYRNLEKLCNYPSRKNATISFASFIRMKYSQKFYRLNCLLLE